MCRNSNNNSSNNNDIFDKKTIFRLIYWIVILGLIVPFASEFILPFFFPECNISSVSVWNQFVSIILGVIATIMSIVSLVLCYRSEEKSNEVNSSINLILNSITEKVNEIGRKQDALVERNNNIMATMSTMIVEYNKKNDKSTYDDKQEVNP